MSDEPLHRRLGLADDEFERILETLGRDPHPAELAMYGAMWSEHCSYKSSKMHLRTLPTEGSAVLVGPGEDAGAVDVGDGMAAVFKMESHSHPSAIEPYQGAATGVGGIVRDIISMGARPVALLDPLVFGPLTDARNRWLLEGVVAGIGGYGNCIGVPTVGGEMRFAEPHSANPTVDVMCVGLAEAGALVTGTSLTPHVGSFMVLYGATTGRDGIGGVSVLASATLDDSSEESRPSVQIGDPFAEKLLIEASLELIDQGLLEGLQDLGGAGITCAVSESAARAGMGAVLDLDAVLLREQGMQAFEILTSESQERMLALVHPSKLDDVRSVCERWGLQIAVIAELVEGGTLTVTHGGDLVAEVPAVSLVDDGPVYDRPQEAPASDDIAADDPTFLPYEGDPLESLQAVLAAPNVASKRWVWQQYDSLVQGQTVAGAGGDAAVVRLPGTMRALALSTDGKGRYGSLDPHLGAMHAVAESARNVAVTGARPLAITNCLNFGNPERPVVMWQFAESIRGIRDACLAFDTPVTGGNVSFYNEFGRLGDLADPGHRHARPARGPPSAGAVGVPAGRARHLRAGGDLPRAGWVGVRRGRVRRRRRASAGPRSREGTSAALAAHRRGEGRSALERTRLCRRRARDRARGIGDRGWPRFRCDDRHGPACSRGAVQRERFWAVASVAPAHESVFSELADSHGVSVQRLGETGGPRVVFDGMFETTLAELRNIYETAIPRLLGQVV